MGIRIGAVWTREDGEGAKVTTGELSSPCGINIPANSSVKISLVKNDRKTDDKHPDYFIEAWTPKQ